MAGMQELKQRTQFVENLKKKAKARGERLSDQQALVLYNQAVKEKSKGGADVNRPRTLIGRAVRKVKGG